MISSSLNTANTSAVTEIHQGSTQTDSGVSQTGPATTPDAGMASKALFNEADWMHALPLATRLFTMASSDPSVSYRLGTCLQRMGKHAEALPIFTHCVLSEGDQPTPGPLLRLGECMASLGLTEEALTAFDSCVELARCDTAYSALQDIAAHKSAALRAG